LRDLKSVVAKANETCPALILILVDWPDQYPISDVERLFSTFPTARIVTCVSAWCASINRSRAVWPLASIVAEHELSARLALEASVLKGIAEAIPVTGQREDVVRTRFESGSALTMTSELSVKVVSPNTAFGQWLSDALDGIDDLKVGGSHPPVDRGLCVVDGDPWTDEVRRRVSTAAAKSATKVLVLTDALDPASHPAAEEGLAVASKFASPCEWIRYLLATTATIAMALLSGCAPASGPKAVAVAPAEGSWAGQVAAVRDGKSGRITVTTPVKRAEWMELAKGCEGVEVIEVEDPEIVDSDFEILLRLPQLRRLALGVAVGDPGAALIAKCGSLKELNLPRSQITDAGMKSLASLPLTQLRVGSRLITDTGVAELRGLSELKFLHLIGTPIGDVGLESIREIHSLQSFYLDGGRCTDEGLSALIRARPDLHFHRDQVHLPDDPNADAH
jgi:hypothetical protein